MLKWVVVVKFHGVLNRRCSLCYMAPDLRFFLFLFFLTFKTMCSMDCFWTPKLSLLYVMAIYILWFQFDYMRHFLCIFFRIGNCGVRIIRIPKREGDVLETFPEFSSIFPHFTRLFRLFSSSDSRRGLKMIRLWIEMVEITGEYHRKITTGLPWFFL